VSRRALFAASIPFAGALVASGCPAPQTPPEPPPPAVSSAVCVAEQPKPPPDVPWKDVEALCKSTSRGAPRPDVTPRIGPDGLKDPDQYAQRVRDFLRGLDYRKAGWLHDANWRMTGEFEGCPCPGEAECEGTVSKGPHPAVRVYYSPEVIDWMCKYRKGEDELPNAEDMPEGAMIIKEMLSPSAVNLALVPGTKSMWIAPMPGKDAGYYDGAFNAWTVMIKAPKGSADGWYWAYFDKSSTYNPPIVDRSGFTQDGYPGQDGKPVTAPPGCEWLPTYWQYTVNDVTFPNYGFGNYCVYCHASAQGQLTFSSFTNILGQEIQYDWSPAASKKKDFDDHDRNKDHEKDEAKDSKCLPSPFPTQLPDGSPQPGFKATFPELNPSYQDVWSTRLPAQTWDHAVSRLGDKTVKPEASQFLTSDQCQGCHEAGGQSQVMPYMVVTSDDEAKTQIDLSPWAEWSTSPMGLAGRDPIFHSQLELERNIAADEPDLAKIRDCIDNTCLHCHGATGARQYNIDTEGQGPAGDPCKDFLPPKPDRKATNYDGKLFTQKMVFAWRDEDAEHAKYGGLARDGINCTVCHHISDKDLDQQNLTKTFTGNFRVGPPDKLFGPFPNEASKDEVLVKPMKNALGITPELGKQTQGSELCGTCHTVFLPVFDHRGKRAGTSYEQTTYLEWLFSDFNTTGAGRGAGKSCQDCHMESKLGSHELKTGIANVQDTRYPKADFLLAQKDVNVPERPYNRHKLYGLNVLLNAFAQQFPLLLGIRQQDYMNGNVRAPLLTALDSVLEVAREETAEVKLDRVAWKGDDLEASVTVKNQGGHNLPSGVGFRRLFIELVVLDDAGKALWASGRTNSLGVILRGTTDEPLPTEFWQRGHDGLPFQPHHQVITSESQAQIYEEITQSSSLEITSSFLHRYWELKDNRMRPQGYNPARVADAKLREEYGDATRPGIGPHQHWFPKPARPERYKNKQFPALEAYTDTKGDPDYDVSAHPAKDGLPGSDSVNYRIRLSPELRASAKKIQVTLYYQSAPPHFLKERFARAAKKGAESRAATQIYYMAGHLNTGANRQVPGERPYLEGYKVQVATPVSQGLPTR